MILEKELGFSGNIYVKAQLEQKYNGENIAKIDQGYLDYYTKNVDFRVGKQIIRWGTGYRFKPNDVFNPNDMTGYKAFFDKMAINAVKANYYLPNRSEISLVVTPESKVQKMGLEKENDVAKRTAAEFGVQTYQQLIQDPNFKALLDAWSNYGINIDENTVQNWMAPEYDKPLDNPQVGLRFTKRGVKGFDYSVMLSQTTEKTIVLDKKFFQETLPQELTNLTNKTNGYLTKGMLGKALDVVENYEIPIKYVYPEITNIGFSAIGQVGKQNVWIDMNYSIFGEEEYLDGGYYVIGHDMKLANNLYLTNQLTYAAPILKGDDELITLNWIFEYPINNKHEFILTSMYDISNNGFSLEPQFNYQLNKSSQLQLGLTWLGAEEEGDPMTWFSKDRVYSRLKVDF
ncbi:hypothetical protein [Halanaerobacter jeridensis]|uniref:Uncharacterized protein n=1 Tax=Halanaerobacter jeridensis TaxID=706427 RepID=A0A939BMS7_9FIRM|nr:hypothetical protein [Halanaerobacter jeridensis]MBM7557345.1 hypothetical protein [Halanaerobacter jeridensis]